MRKYEKSEKYNKQFVTENMMGPNSMWLLEEVCEKLDLKPGMRVLDMGCGKGLTSIFLAKEYGVTVFANDLWIPATENFIRFKQLCVDDTVFPIHAEAHELPYANGFFDAAISIDSYHYYGANETYFPEYYAKLVRPGGQFGIACPGLTREWGNTLPENLRYWWEDEMDGYLTFHSAKWWHDVWAKSGLVEIKSYGDITDAREIWYDWGANVNPHAKGDAPLLDADTDGWLTLIYMTAVKRWEKTYEHN